MKTFRFLTSMGACMLMHAPIAFLYAQVPQAEVTRVHQRAVVIDTHTDTPMVMAIQGFNLAERHEATTARVDIPRLIEGDVDAIFFGVFTTQRPRTPENYDQAYRLANRMLDSVEVAVLRNSGTVAIATSAEAVQRLSKQHKIAICIGMENGFPIATALPRLTEFYNRGVRYITLCHSSNNDICDSSNDPTGAEHDGLSSFGNDVVNEMNRLGMIIDVSHVSDKAFFDIIETSRAPVIASHSSVRALCNVRRNMSDEMIKALAHNGGVIQICILGAYIAPEDTNSENYIKHEALRLKYHNWQYRDDNERKAAWHAYDSLNKFCPPVLPTVAQAVDHIDYVVKLVGIDHVGIGSDFDGGGGLADCTDVADFPNITAELLKRGYTQNQINKIWGGNFLRVFNAVERARGT